jgi:hypothetical protein
MQRGNAIHKAAEDVVRNKARYSPELEGVREQLEFLRDNFAVLKNSGVSSRLGLDWA